jgi:hypothetical protein
MVTILNRLNGSWEDVRGGLSTDLAHLVSALNSRWAQTLGDTNQLSLSDNVKDVLLPANGGSAGHTLIQDAATLFIDPTAGTFFYVEAGGNRTLTLSRTPAPGQRLTIAHKAVGGANRTLTLTTGTDQFRFGTTIAALSATVSTQIDYIEGVYNSTARRVDVINYVKGYV